MLCNSCYNSCCTCCTPSDCRPVPTTTTTTTTTTLCPDAIPCTEAYVTDCIVYTACDNACSQIKTGDSLTEVFATLFQMINQCGSLTTTTLEPTTTTTTTLTPTTTTTTLTPTTTTTTIAPDATKCVDCIPELSDVTQNVIGKLTVGNLISTAISPCVVGDYVIDWYLDSTSGSIQFTSGIGSDPDIDQLHPFTGTAARPCLAGDWIPVIRYVFLNGTKYTSTNIPGQAYSPDLATCLEPVVVVNLNCSNGDNPVNGYTHVITYQATIQNPADSIRNFIFDLDNVVNYFAWQFIPVSVSDRIEFYHVSGATQTLLGDYAIGLDVITDFSGSTKKIYSNTYKDVFDLSTFTYTAGDHISIKITSSYANPSIQNTNWTFYCACLDTFDCSYPANLEMNICSPVMTYSPSLCKYTLEYSFVNYPDYTNTDVYKYLTNFTQSVVGQIVELPSPGDPNIKLEFGYGLFCGPNVLTPGSCTSSSLKSLSKVGNIYTIDFTDNAEYLIWKNQYNSNYTILNTGYNASPTSIDHYRFMIIRYIVDPGLIGCGDNLLNTDIYFHISSVVTFNDTNQTMEINVLNTVNSLTPYCDNSCSTIPEITFVANTIAATNFSNLQSTVRPSNQGRILYVLTNVSAQTGSAQQSDYHYLPYGTAGYICDPADNFCVGPINSPSNTQNVFYRFNHYYNITDITDGVRNFKIQSTIDANGCFITNPSAYITLYEIANGIIITPTGGCS